MKNEDLALSFERGLSPRGVVHLLEQFGSAEAVYLASEAELINRAELRADIARNIVKRATFSAAKREAALCKDRGIEVVASTDSAYPEQLRFMADYPHIIYMVGNSSLLASGKLCALVGERDSISSYGEKMVYRLLEQIADIAPEVVVVGALEGGVDGVALRCAHHFGLRCIGVTDSPLSQIVPQSCERIAAEILDSGGALLSEVGVHSAVVDTEHAAHHRIIAGLCGAVVVVEGSKVPQVAKFADGYGRTLFAVPGRVTDPMSSGTNAMISSSMAQMVCTGRDILEQLGWE